MRTTPRCTHPAKGVCPVQIMTGRSVLLVLLTMVLVTGVVAWRCAAPPAEELLLLSGAGLRPAVDDIVEQFTARAGIPVRVDYNASSLLLGRIQIGREGDLFLPGEEHYVQLAREAGLIHESRTATIFVPVIMVGRGNPKRIQTLSDLTQDGVRLGLADERTAAIGRLARQILEKNALCRDAIEKNLVYESLTIPELAAAVDLGHVDAAIVWAPVAAGFANAETVPIPPDKNILAAVPIAVLSCSRHKAAARTFAEFVLSEQGQAVFRKHGYDTPQAEQEIKE